MLNLENDGLVTISLFAMDDIVLGNAIMTKEISVTSGYKDMHCQDFKLPDEFEDKYVAVLIKADVDGKQTMSYKSFFE